MAHDGYRSPGPAEQPSFFDPDERLGQTLHKTRSQQSSVEYERHRTSEIPSSNSRDAGYKNAQQPINDAVTSAFDKADTSHGISPELLSQITSQITANVIQQLKTSNLKPSAIPDSNSSNHIPTTNGISLSRSPSTTSPKETNRPVYTPPSPTRPMEDLSPQSSYSQPKYTHPAHGDRATPERSSPVSHASQSPTKELKKDAEARSKTSSVRLSFGQEATIVEKTWGTLYDENGLPTARLGQFLRGIANHLIEDYEPRNSLVVLPSKMQKFYKDTAISKELYPWQLVFDDRTSSISRLYREIGAVHHLVQEESKYDERPDIPGLTPVGFQKWATLMLKANPEQEFERLQKVVLEMPISNADNRKDRFPKEISRRLFPGERDNAAREKLEKAMTTHCNINLPSKRPSESESGHQHRRKTETTVHQPKPPSETSNGIERERQPYSGASSTASGAEDDDDAPTPQPIERERKPYSSNPGAGKVYEDMNKPSDTSKPHEANKPHETQKTQDNMRPPPPPSQPTTSAPADNPRDQAGTRYRANSTAARRYDPTYPESSSTTSTSQSRPIPIASASSKANGPPPSSFDALNSISSTGDQRSHLQPRSGSIHRSRSTRHRSPSNSDSYRRSEPDYLTSSTPYQELRPEAREPRDRDPDRSYRDDSSRMSMYEMGTSASGRDRGQYRYEGGGSISSGVGVAAPPPQSYHHPSTSGGRDYYSSDDERYRPGPSRGPTLSATPGAGYEYGSSPSSYYR